MRKYRYMYTKVSQCQAYPSTLQSMVLYIMADKDVSEEGKVDIVIK